MKRLAILLVAVGLLFGVGAAVVFAAGSSPSFTFSSDEAGATFTCSLDGATPSTCTSPLTQTGLKPGAHSETIIGSFTVPQPVSYAPTYVQSNATLNSAGSGVTTTSTPFQSGVTSGDLIVIAVGYRGDAQTIGLTDTLGTTFHVAGSPVTSTQTNGPFTGEIEWGIAPTGGADTVTASFPASTGYVELYDHEYNAVGVQLDATSKDSGSGTAITSGAATTSYTNELVFGYGISNNTVGAAGTGFTERQSVGGDMTEDRDANATGSYAATATNGSSTGWQALEATFWGSGPNDVTSTSTTATTTTTTSTTSTTPTTTTTTPSACPSTTPNTPDGADPWGGCFPGPVTSGIPSSVTPVNIGTTIQPPNAALPSDNTGWTNSGGTIVLTGANAVVDGVLSPGGSSGGLYVSGGCAAGCTVKDSNVGGHVNFNGGAGSSLTIENTTIYGGSDTNWDAIDDLGSRTLTVNGDNISGGGHGILCYSNCTIENTYINNLISPSGGAHQNPILFDGGSNNSVTHSTVHCVPGNSCTSELSLLLNDGEQVNETMTKNLIMAAGPQASHCVYPGPNYATAPNEVSNVNWIDNVIQRGSNGQCDASNGPVYGWYPGTCSPVACTWSGNIWDDGTVWNP